MKRKVFFSALATALFTIMMGATVFAGPAETAAAIEHTKLDWTVNKAAEITNNVYAQGNAAVAKETAAAISTAQTAMADAGQVQPAQIVADSQAVLAKKAADAAAKQQAAINDLNKKAADQLATAQKVAAIKNDTAAKIAAAKAKQAALDAALVDPANNQAKAARAAADAACAQFEAQNAATQVVIKKAYENKIAAIDSACKEIQAQYYATADALNAYNKAATEYRVANIVAGGQKKVNEYALANAAYQHGTVASITTLLAKRPQVAGNTVFMTALDQQVERAAKADKDVVKTSLDLITAIDYAKAAAAPVAPAEKAADINVSLLKAIEAKYPGNAITVIKANDEAVAAARAEAEKAGAALKPAYAAAAAAEQAAFNARVIANSSAYLAKAYENAYAATVARNQKVIDDGLKTYNFALANRVDLLNKANAAAAANAQKIGALQADVDAKKAKAAASFAVAANQHAVMEVTKAVAAKSMADTYTNSVAAITAQSIITAAAYDAAVVEKAKDATDLAFIAACREPLAQRLLAEHIKDYYWKVYAVRK